jgi:hypothetical protein
MKNRAQFYLTVFCAVLFFDVITSCASRLLAFDYTKLALVSWVLYGVAGYFGCKYHGFLAGVLAGLIAGLADSTAGWALSFAIGPFLPTHRAHHTFGMILLTVAVVSISGVLFSAIGAGLRMLVLRGKRWADA